MENLYENNMKTLSKAIEYCDMVFSYDEIINILSSDDDIKKQLCIINLNCINSQADADILVDNLTLHSGPIRETVSFKILELIANPDYKKFFQTENILNSFINAVADINPSVSRNTVEIIKHVSDSQYIYLNIINKINNILEKTDNEVKNRSYIQNKKNFSLYWNLEALISISDKVKADVELFKILEKTAISNDYTIREKTAKTANVYLKNNSKFQKILDILKDDLNIYVKKYL